MKDSMKNKVIVITGASDGIGAELARQLAPLGAKLVLAARSTDKLHAVAAECQALGAQTAVVQCDVTLKDDCTRLTTEAVAAFGGIDILVNNAGVSMHGWFADTPDTVVYEKLFAVNVMGTINCTHAAMPYLKASRGMIVGLASLAGKFGVPARTAYCMTKFAMNGFFEALRIELVRDGVAVCMIQPGVVATNIRRNGWNALGEVAGSSGLSEKNAMPLDVCVNEIVDAMQTRKREVIMSGRGKLAVLMRVLWPAFVDNLALKALSKVGQRKS